MYFPKVRCVLSKVRGLIIDHSEVSIDIPYHTPPLQCTSSFSISDMPPRTADRSITTCRNCRYAYSSRQSHGKKNVSADERTRRRKIRCDRGRPRCNRCRETGTVVSSSIGSACVASRSMPRAYMLHQSLPSKNAGMLKRSHDWTANKVVCSACTRTRCHDKPEDTSS